MAHTHIGLRELESRRLKEALALETELEEVKGLRARLAFFANAVEAGVYRHSDHGLVERADALLRSVECRRMVIAAIDAEVQLERKVSEGIVPMTSGRVKRRSWAELAIFASVMVLPLFVFVGAGVFLTSRAHAGSKDNVAVANLTALPVAPSYTFTPPRTGSDFGRADYPARTSGIGPIAEVRVPLPVYFVTADRASSLRPTGNPSIDRALAAKKAKSTPPIPQRNPTRPESGF